VKPRLRFGFWAAGLALAPGCGIIHKVDRAPAPPVAVPSAFKEQGAGPSAGAAAPRGQERWWRAFGDPGLDKVMDDVLAHNLGLKQAFARLEQAEAVRDAGRAGYLPSLNAEASVGRSRSVFNFGSASPTGGAFSVEQTQYNLSLAASYEVDLWGRVHSMARASELDFLATGEDVAAATMTLSAQVAEVWFQLAEQRASERLLSDQVARNETQLELMELRFGEGLASAVDVLQQRQALAGAKTLLPPVKAARRVLEHQLAVLLGRAPADVDEGALGATLAPLPPLPEVGLPGELVQQRPDVQAARLRVAAADYRVGAALAERFPAIRLTASTGFRAFDLVDLFDNWLWNLVAGLTAPLLDQVRLSANQRAAEARLKDQVAGYGQVVLTAFQEVEDALVRETHQEAMIKELNLQLEAARATYEEAYSRYVNGLSEYLPVLTALRDVQALERAEIQARRQLLSYRVQLCRALGGAWMAALVDESRGTKGSATPVSARGTEVSP
jgi:multidrug efflux system outer membrane protein